MVDFVSSISAVTNGYRPFNIKPVKTKEEALALLRKYRGTGKYHVVAVRKEEKKHMVYRIYFKRRPVSMFSRTGTRGESRNRR